MQKTKRTTTEIIILMAAAFFTLTGLYLFYTDVPRFEQYVVEDGVVEWATVFGLLAGAGVCFARAAKLRGSRPAAFIIALVLFGIILFFGAGEEISWGQRLFAISSPDYFREHNAQGETNIHNLVLGGWRLNRWIFSILLSVVLFAYILLVPFLYGRKKWMQRLVNYWAIPLPQSYQIIAFLICFLLTEVIRHGKRAEILEADLALILLLIIAFPLNRDTFKK